MKVLFDCVVTQNPPSKCSTVIQFYTIAGMLLEAREDLYIYWPIPVWVTDEDMEWYPKSDRIEYIRVPQSRDRMKEYTRISPELEKLLAFNGSHWDWDVLVTMRSHMVPIMRAISIRPGQGAREWTKRIYLIENMMIMSCKPTVAQSTVDVQDRLCFEAYLASDKTLLPAYHQKKLALAIAKDHFSAARLRNLQDKIMEVCQLDLPRLGLKDLAFRYDKSRQMNVVFVGRMEKGNARLEMINEVFSNQFILSSEKVRSNVCTVSPGVKVFDKDITNVLHPQREEFWRLCREEMDLGVYAHVDVELNLSMLEPISMGVPALVKDAPWSRAMLGETYPFFFTNSTQAYAWVSAFEKDYAAQYRKFEDWFEDWFRPTYKTRMGDQGLYSTLMSLILGHVPSQEQEKSLASMEKNSIVTILRKKGGSEFIMFDLIEKLAKTDLRSLADKANNDDREYRSITFSTPWNDFRVGLTHFHGYRDASLKVGHLIKDSQE